MDISLPTLIVILVLLLIFFVTLIFIFSKKYKPNKNIALSLFLIKVPKFTKAELPEASKDFVQKSLGQIETLFTSLAGLKAEKKWFGPREDLFAVEIVSQAGQIFFYVAVPKKYQEYFIQQVQVAYPKVNFEEVKDYNIFQKDSQIRAGYLKFSQNPALPIKTYQAFENDPMEAITNAGSKLMANEAAAIQYLFRSAPKQWRQQSRNISKNIGKGMSLSEAVNKTGGWDFFKLITWFLNFVLNLFSTSKKTDEQSKSEERHQLSTMEQQSVKMIEEKSSKPGLDVNIRVVVATPDAVRSQNLLQDLLNSFTQYNIYEFGNSFKATIPKNISELLTSFIYRQFSEKSKILLNAEEMTSVIHLPLETTATPNIVWLEATKAAPPVDMPQEGVVLGKNVYRNKETLVRIKDDDRRRHMYIIGQTGVGKSVLQESLIIQDIANGKGVCVVDPHGDLVEKVLAHIPKERAEDVILFDPADSSRPLGLNMLEYDTEEQKTFVINEMIAIFDKLYDLKATGGPMFEQYMRNAMLLVMDDPNNQATLIEIPKVLADAEYRKQKLAAVSNRFVKDFWEKEAQKAGGEAALANMVPYITSKLTPFISNDLIRPIISQEKSAFKFREAIEQNKIVLVNLSKGKVGEMNSNLLGMIIIGKILFAALSSADKAEEQRHDFYLYIDEFQNFVTDTISVILSEARKYRLNLILAHQFIAQLTKNNDTKVRDAIFGNVGTIISFRIGVEDAELIAKQMAPVVSQYDLVNMPKYTCYIRLLINNQNPPAFNFNPIMPEKGNFELAQAIKQLSKLKYGKDRQQIEAEVSQRLNII